MSPFLAKYLIVINVLIIYIYIYIVFLSFFHQLVENIITSFQVNIYWISTVFSTVSGASKTVMIMLDSFLSFRGS